MPQNPGIPQFDALRRRLQGQFQQKKQEAGDALQRRFASQGMLSSGAFGKAQEEQERQFAKDEADATAQLDFAEMNEAQRRKEVEEARAFQKSERQASQDFASSERQASQLFNKDLFDRDMAFKQAVFSDESRARWEQIGLALKEFEESKKANMVNTKIALSDIDSEDFSHGENLYYELFPDERPKPLQQTAPSQTIGGPPTRRGTYSAEVSGNYIWNGSRWLPR